MVTAAVAALARATGAAPSTMAAAIGPHISGAAYEVGAEVVAGLEAGGLDPRLFLRSSSGARPRVDLGAAIASQLEACDAAGQPLLPRGGRGSLVVEVSPARPPPRDPTQCSASSSAPSGAEKVCEV